MIQRANDEVYEGFQSYPIVTDDFATRHCSPVIAASLSETADLAEKTLLHDERDQDWPSWLALVGTTANDPVQGPSFSDPHHCLMTAEASHGIALASWFETRATR